MMKTAKYGYYIGYSTDKDIQYKASSGGIGTAVTKYLLDNKIFDSALAFHFNQERCCYEPIIIHNSKDLNICGSIYQDIDIPKFIKEHISEIGDGIIVSCTPCQVAAVKHILKAYDEKSFIISFCCSGQTTVEGTWKYYQLVGINKNDIVNMQYRGNGWPSGIQIWLKDGRKLYKPNFTEPWATLHRSLLYSPKRCFYCKLDTSYLSDISIADPWLDSYKKEDKLGHSLFIINTEQGYNIMNEMFTRGLISEKKVDINTYLTAQKVNIEKEKLVNRYRKAYKFLLSLRSNPLYFRIASHNIITMRLSLKLNRVIKKLIR